MKKSVKKLLSSLMLILVMALVGVVSVKYTALAEEETLEPIDDCEEAVVVELKIDDYTQTTSTQLTLTDVSVVNILTTKTGGAVHTTGTVTIEDCTFTKNAHDISSASTAKGAAVYYDGSSGEGLTIDNCIFTSNRATTGSGGAVYVFAGSAQISNSQFDSNVSNGTDGGGAIFVRIGTTTISGCSFNLNEATNNGGAVYAYKGTVNIQDGSEFNKNSAQNGGAIYVANASYPITVQTSCTFSENTAVNGGAIYNIAKGSALTTAAFVNNTAESQGGAVSTTANMTIDCCVFDKNSEGNAIYNETDAFAITNTTLINQTVGDFNNVTLVTQETTDATTSAVANIFDAGNDYRMYLLTNMEETEYESYCCSLTSIGYVLESENEMSSSEENENVARTYYFSEEGYMIHTYWAEFSQEVRTLIAEVEESQLAPLQKSSETAVTSEKSDTSCTPLFHQLEALNYSDSGYHDGGMGYIIRLTDGRFIIVDGGHRTETIDPADTSGKTYADNDAYDIMKFLAENAPDPDNIVIAAWFITHAHNDHGGAFIHFTKHQDQHKTNVEKATGITVGTITLESLMFNACDTEEQMAYCESMTKDIESMMTDYWTDALVYKPLTGQVYTFANTSIEILYTMSDFLPNVITQESDVTEDNGGINGDYNIQSVVSIVDIDNTVDKSDRFFIMADTTATACDEMSRRYGDYMASDYVQVAHHGINEITGQANCRRHGATQEIYEYILKDDKSTVAMWPTSVDRYNNRIVSTVAVNYWLVTEAPVKEHWIAESVSDDNRTIEFY